MNRIKAFFKDPFNTSRIIFFLVIIIEGFLFWKLPDLMVQNNIIDTTKQNFPVLLIQIINSIVAYMFSYLTMLSYEKGDFHRKIWRFVMFSMFFLMLGHMISFFSIYVFKVPKIPSSGWQIWFSFAWVLPMLLIGLTRQYNLVKTASPPNTFLKRGLWSVIILYAFTLLLISPIFSKGSVSLSERLVALWNIGFAFACVIISVALLSEIYKGLLSRSWKIIIFAVLFFSLNFTVFHFLGSNNVALQTEIVFVKKLVEVTPKLLSQVGPLLIILASYVELRIFKIS